MVGVFNQTDETEANYSRYTAFGAQLGLYGQYINFLGGEDYAQIDFTGGFDRTRATTRWAPGMAGLNHRYTN